MLHPVLGALALASLVSNPVTLASESYPGLTDPDHAAERVILSTALADTLLPRDPSPRCANEWGIVSIGVFRLGTPIAATR